MIERPCDRCGLPDCPGAPRFKGICDKANALGTSRRPQRVFVSKPCEDCGVAVVDDPTLQYTAWLCYWCHCVRAKIDPKSRLNQLAEFIKTGKLVEKK